MHAHGGGSPPPLSRRVTTVLAAVVGAVIIATMAGLVMLWPPDVEPVVGVGNPYESVDFLAGRIESVRRATCEGTSADRLPDGSIPASVQCVTARVSTEPGHVAGVPAELDIALPPSVDRAGVGVGDRIRIARYPAVDGQPPVYAWSDVARAGPLGALAIGFALLVVAVARLKGLASLLGLSVAFVAIDRFVIPALLAGENPVAVALVAGTAIMTVLLYSAHGVNVKTTTALLGTLAGLLATSALAVWATSATHLTGLDDEQGGRLSQLTTQAGLGDVILCGVIIAGLGVLNDVTISQASAVWELHAAAPHLSARRLFAGAMRIGRDHLASVVYTIAFVYAGAALPVLMLERIYGRPLSDLLVSGGVAEELVRTLVTSAGLVLTIPLTTAVAALLATATVQRRQPA
ncbi:MAG: YibE/F family protein [Kineosporiaceae bacterium]|nr:YibE/F family protein [Kineosporiaceae bacterium]MBK7621810.1 YibE/F family protein [Kineosporiaceae bacterium]MBK8077734.1 YibE/F family protein [Kineosporiaceae bacterium]